MAVGVSSQGALRNGVKLPLEGDGYVVPARWRQRGNNWGTEELVEIVVRAARRVEREFPGATLGVADLSPPGGGGSEWHRSHQNGLDADLMFYDNRGTPPNTMLYFNPDGTSKPPLAEDPDAIAAGPRRIDIKREWALVKALLTDPHVEVQFLFVYEPLRQRLLRHAAELGEPQMLIDQAAATLRQPAGAAPHDDHLHLRIYCPRSDRELGCVDREPLRWTRKEHKYPELFGALEVAAMVPVPIAAFGAQVLCSIGPVIM